MSGSSGSGPRHGVPAALRTAICELFGIEIPIVQTGMGWVSGARLTAATSSTGALGILASTTMTYDQLATAIVEVRRRTDRPFGVNLRPNTPRYAVSSTF